MHDKKIENNYYSLIMPVNNMNEISSDKIYSANAQTNQSEYPV